MDKSEIQDALEHEHKMIHILRQRLQQRELQEAQYGIDTPPQVLTEIQELRDRICGHEAEQARLQTLAVEEQFPLASAEFRVMLAEEWLRNGGRAGVASAARLELRRLQLGIPCEQAQQFTQEIRADLAHEALSQLSRKDLVDLFVSTGQAVGDYLDALESGYDGAAQERIARAFASLAGAISYDPQAAAADVLMAISADDLLPAAEIEQTLLRYARFYPYRYDQAAFSRFLACFAPG
jgi:hypothetical protein